MASPFDCIITLCGDHVCINVVPLHGGLVVGEAGRGTNGGTHPVIAYGLSLCFRLRLRLRSRPRSGRGR